MFGNLGVESRRSFSARSPPPLRIRMLRSVLALAVVSNGACFNIGGLSMMSNPTPLATPMPSVPRTPASLQMRTANMMDEGVFKFNKVVIDTVYDFICLFYNKNDLKKNSISECTARFYVLETVARVPYFAYLSVMHLRETFGSRVPGDKDRMRTHYAEADNELHHLLIMEQLGGNSSLVDRTLAQTMAFAYYCERRSPQLDQPVDAERALTAQSFLS